MWVCVCVHACVYVSLLECVYVYAYLYVQIFRLYMYMRTHICIKPHHLTVEPVKSSQAVG